MDKKYNKPEDVCDIADLYKSASAPSPLDSDDIPHEHSHAFPLRRRKSLLEVLLTFLGMYLLVIVIALASDFGILNFGTAVWGNVYDGTPIFDESLSALVVDTIRVNLTTTQIDVRTHDGNDIRIVFTPPFGRNYIHPVYHLNTGNRTLRIGIPLDTYRDPFFSLGLNDNSTLTIYLPSRGRLSTIEIRTTDGNITAENVNARFFMATTRNGDIQLTDLQSVELMSVAINGRQDITNASALSIAYIDSRGAINITYSRFSRQTIIYGASGDISITNSRIGGTLEISASSGAITLYNVDVNLDRAEITNDPDAPISIIPYSN